MTGKLLGASALLASALWTVLSVLSRQRRQTALLRPKLIVCLGRIAAKAIIKEDFKITAEHGKWFQRGGVQMTAIYHPSALLRDVEKRPETFVDLKAIQAKVREICTHTDC